MEKKFFVFVIALSVLCTLIAKPQDDLFTACLQGDLAGVKEAVESGADVKALNPASGQNALAHAFFYPEITRYLLEKGCDPNGGNYPALVSASSVASLDVMKLLLENGADPNLPGINESALLKVVQMTNCPDAAELLLSKGADIKTTTSNYANLLGVYASYGLPQIERKAAMTAYGNILKGYGLTVPEWYFNPSENLNEPPIEMVNVLVAAGLDINKRGTNLYDKKKSGEPPIFIAMNVGHQEIMLSLLEYGADYNETYLPILPELPLFAIEGELTPLMYACIKGYKSIAKWILQQPDIANPAFSGKMITEKGMIIQLTGVSVMYLAIIINDMDLVKLLAESPLEWEDFVIKALPGQKFDKSYGSKPPAYQFLYTKKSKLIYTPSLWAEHSGQSEMAEYLKSQGL